MTKGKKEQNSQQKNQFKQKPLDNKDSFRSNRSLLWAIFVFLVALVVLVIILIMTNIMNRQLDIEPMKQGITENKKPLFLDDIPQPPTPAPVVKPPIVPSESVQNKKPNPEKCKATKFDGKKYDDGEFYTTLDGCETCTCDDGDWDCVIKPSCIILPSDCAHNNHIYHDGEARSAECDQTCTCDSGNWNCVMAPGSSCCQSGGNLYHNGESFPAGDGCNTCNCNNGSVNCTMMLCI